LLEIVYPFLLTFVVGIRDELLEAGEDLTFISMRGDLRLLFYYSAVIGLEEFSRLRMACLAGSNQSFFMNTFFAE